MPEVKCLSSVCKVLGGLRKEGDLGIWADTSLGLLGTDERNVDHGDEQNRCFQLDPHMYM